MASRFAKDRTTEPAADRATARSRAPDRRATQLPGTSYADRGLLHLGELIPHLRTSLNIGRSDLSDEVILESLKFITARTDERARWLGAFNSPLGRWLVLRGSDLNTELSQLIALLPPPRS